MNLPQWTIGTFVVFVLMLLPLATMAETVDIIEIDGYERKADPGETHMFIWTLRNVDELKMNFTVNVTVLDTNGWNVTMSPETAVLPYSDVRTFTLTVEIPQNGSGRKRIEVVFMVFQNGSPVKYSEQQVLISIDEPVTEEDEDLVFGLWKNPFGPPLDNEYGIFVMNVLLWLGISFLAVVAMDPIVKHYTRKSKNKLDDRVLAIVHTPIIVLLFFYGAIVSLRVIDHLIPGWVITMSEQAYFLVFTLMIFYMVYKIFKEVVVFYGHILSKKTATDLDDLLVPLIEKIGVVIIGLIAVGALLGYLGIDLTLFVAGGVVISMVIAFAAQETLSNFFSGIFILTDRPFKKGDNIILGDNTWYQVRNIGLRSTRLYRYSDAAMVTIPNNKLGTDIIALFDNADDPGKVSKNIGVGYGSDTVQVKRILKEIIDANEHILKDDPDLEPIIRFDELGDSAIMFKIIVWLDDRASRWSVMDYLNSEIHTRFAEEGIDIPFPQRTVHMAKEGI
jgi:small-conductance mechanosensitive channel